MKKIKLNSKLNLNKETIVKLNDAQMKKLQGGAFTGDQVNVYSERFCNTNLACPASDTFCQTDYNCATKYFCVPPVTK
ncbi:MAG: rSAM-modified peptide [Flavobacterium sp.]|nr:rSAM-modified peptide [Flavobacterium sp.]